MAVTVPDEILRSAHLTDDEMRLEIAITLFQQDRLTLAQAARFAGLGQLDMQRALAGRGIPLHYTDEDLDHDLARALTPRP
jgi:predicted HTH domain antitoxin